MIFKKIFTCRLNIKTLNANFLDRLSEKYRGKCFGNSFILSVDKIIRKSEQYVDFTDIHSSFNIDIEFLATVAVFGANDIMVDVKVIYAEQMKICSYEHLINEEYAPIKALIAIQSSKQSENLILGQKIIIQIKNVKYEPFEETVSISAILMVAETSFHLFKVIGDLNNKLIKDLQLTLQDIHKELKIRNEFSVEQKKKILFIENLYYPFNNENKEEKDTNWYGLKKIEENNELNFLSFIENLNEETKLPNVCYRNLYTYKSSPYISFSENEDLKIKYVENVIDVHPSIIFKDILISIRNHLIMGREFVEKFDDDIINSQKSLWKILTINKLIN